MKTIIASHSCIVDDVNQLSIPGGAKKKKKKKIKDCNERGNLVGVVVPVMLAELRPLYKLNNLTEFLSLYNTSLHLYMYIYLLIRNRTRSK